MIGYKRDTKVTILEEESSFIREKLIPISELTENDYVKVAHFTNWNYEYRKVPVSSGEYKGKLYSVSIGFGKIEFCEGQKLLSATYLDDYSLPILEEKLIEEIDKENKRETLLYSVSQDGFNMDQGISIEEWVEQYNNASVKFWVKEEEIGEVTEEDFKGILYNITLPIDYGLSIDNFKFNTCLH